MSPSGKEVEVQHEDNGRISTDVPVKKKKFGIGLCLSGGGYRAAIFHLGALSRLNELGVLSRVETISAVSGGSILAGFLATAMIKHPPVGERYSASEWEECFARPFRLVVRRNIRTWPVLSRLLPWNWFSRQTAVYGLKKQYENLTEGLRMNDLPDHPRFVFCATDMVFGKNWESRADRVGDYLAGYVSPPPDEWTMGRAMAASSCFPPVFAPIRAGIPGNLYNRRGDRNGTRTEQDRKRNRIWLTDGGVFDNLGTEPVWKNHRVVLVSDAGSALSYRSGCGPIWQLTRYTPIIQDQAAAVRKRWLIHSYKQKVYAGTYWGISSATSSYVEHPEYGFSKELAEQVLAKVRTDLDAFSDREIDILERHGYEIADMAIRTHAPEIAPDLDTPLKYNAPVDETEVRRWLRQSHKRCLLGRF